MRTAFVIVVILAVLVTLGWFVFARQHPENASGHVERGRTGAQRVTGHPNDRPGGPGAEADGLAGPGEPMPGPSAESPPAGFDNEP